MIDDIYFQDDYINLYLNDGNSSFDFRFEENQSVFSNKTIKRKIDYVGQVSVANQRRYDTETAYGYGGYQTNTPDAKFVRQAIDTYSRFCVDQNVISEFMRFHPFNSFPQQFPQFFDFLVPDRQTVVVDLSLTKEQRWSQYDANTRNVLRKAEKALTFERTEEITVFMEMYHETMERNQAEDFYFFHEAYFRRLIGLENCHLYQVKLGQEVICSSFVLLGKEIAHYHLSANRTAFLKHNGNYFLLDNLFGQAQREGKKYFHLGGGRTNQENDSLLLFKRKFSKTLLTFYIAGKIFIPEAYRELCNLWQQQSDKQQKYFLKYRLPLK